MGDVPLGVATGGAQRVHADRERRGEALEREMAATDNARVGESVKVGAGLLDDPIEALDFAPGVAQRAVDPDLIDGRPDAAASSASITAASSSASSSSEPTSRSRRSL